MVDLWWPLRGPAIGFKQDHVILPAVVICRLESKKRTFRISVMGTPRHNSLDILLDQLYGSAKTPTSPRSAQEHGTDGGQRSSFTM